MERQVLGGRIEDPYRFLAISILRESFRTIKCYFANDGTNEERLDGKDALLWIKKMDGSFKAVAIACNYSLSTFHQLCLLKISQIKQEVRKQHEQRRMDGKNKKG